MSNQTLTTPVQDKDMARDFLASLDPNATRFTFQFSGIALPAMLKFFTEHSTRCG